jgi:hypothetical protein
MISKQFPSPYDVAQTLQYHTVSYDDLKRFLQSRGVLNIGFGREDACDFATNMLFDHQDYLLMRSLAQGAEIATNISGFIVKPALVPLNLEDLKQDIVSLRKRFSGQEAELAKKGAPVQKLGMPQVRNGILNVKFEYERTIPGRVELMHRVEAEVDFTIESKNTNEFRIICYPQADQDIKRIEDLFKKLGRGSYTPFSISLDNFSKKQRIQFFDDILDYYAKDEKSEWSLVSVIAITIRQQSLDKDDFVIVNDESGSIELIGENEDTQQVLEDDLLSITQAVLEGKNLRHNSFVKRCERQGYYFPSMTLLLENRKTPEVIQVTIRFKLSPKMFEVILAGMSERHEYGEIPATFTPARQQEVLREFWNKSHEVWYSIDENTVRQTEPEQLTLASVFFDSN